MTEMSHPSAAIAQVLDNMEHYTKDGYLHPEGAWRNMVEESIKKIRALLAASASETPQATPPAPAPPTPQPTEELVSEFVNDYLRGGWSSPSNKAEAADWLTRFLYRAMGAFCHQEPTVDDIAWAQKVIAEERAVAPAPEGATAPSPATEWTFTEYGIGSKAIIVLSANEAEHVKQLLRKRENK